MWGRSRVLGVFSPEGSKCPAKVYPSPNDVCRSPFDLQVCVVVIAWTLWVSELRGTLKFVSAQECGGKVVD